MAEEKIFETLGKLQEAYRQFYSSETNGQFDLRSFAVWLYHQEAGAHPVPHGHKGDVHERISPLHGGIDDQISLIFLDMHKLIKFYIKKALEGTGLVSADDLHFLMTLATTGSMTKSEIINSHITEMSSGTEVIKRLLKRGLIEEFDDPDDKRSKRVKISEGGMKKVTHVGSTLHRLHRLFVGMISEEEKFTLLAVMSKVHRFHVKIFNDERNATLEDLFDRHIEQ